MKNSLIRVFIIGTLVYIPAFFAHADNTATTTIFIRIETATTTLWNSLTEVTACSPTGSGTTTLTGYCAVTATGLPNSWSSYGDDYFLENINGATNDFNTNTYWSWFNDDSYGQTALTGHMLSSGEHLLLTLGIMPLKIELATTTATVSEFSFDASWNGVWTPSASSTIYSGDSVLCITGETGSCTITASTSPTTFFAIKSGFATSSSKTQVATVETPVEIPEPTPTASGSGGSSLVSLPETKTINTAKAIDFLYSKRQNDGSFGAELYTDWAALALAATDNSTYKDPTHGFLQSSVPTLSSITDYERHAMALMSLGINPYSGTNVDCITPIIQAFDGTQIGDVNFINDDIFALFPLLKLGYSPQDAIIDSTVIHIISTQKENGSWNDSIDMTAAALQALSQVQAISGTPNAIQKAKTYIKNTQTSDGGFGSVFSTAWVMQAFSALGENPSDIKNSSGKSPLDSLIEKQAADGGFELEGSQGTRIWSTSYVIPALLGRPWTSLLSSFSKPQQTIVQTSSYTTPSTPIATTSIATTSAPVQPVVLREVVTVPETPIPIVKKEIVMEKEKINTGTKEIIQNSPQKPLSQESLAAVLASSPPKPISDIVVKTVVSIVALSGISFLFIKII